MKYDRYSVRQVAGGKWERYLLTTYDVNLCGDMLQVDGKQLPIKLNYSWAYRLLKTQIQTTYEPKEFMRHFITDDNLTSDAWKYKILDHVRQYGKAI